MPIPRATRSRPILHIIKHGDGIPVFINNINSPGLFHVSTFTLQQESFRANAVTCAMSYPEKFLKNYLNSCCDIVSTVVSFWSDGGDCKPLQTVEVYMPSHWSPRYFLYELQESIFDCSIISLMNTYTVNGVLFPFITINSLHDKYLTG